jgi:hypothetical protein
MCLPANHANRPRAIAGPAILLTLLMIRASAAEISFWKMGGSGLAWEGSDTTRMMVAVDQKANSIQPVYFTQGDNVLQAVSNWSELKVPIELGFVDGHRPRLWYTDGTSIYLSSYFDNTLYVDGDRSTYNTGRGGWLTIDVGVPVPASRFGFLTPAEGFRSDGVPLNQDPIPAYEITISEESDAVLQQPEYHRLGTLIADVRENFSSEVNIDFPKQYVRFIRYLRKPSVLDQASTRTDVLRGTIAEFVLYGQGVPKRAIYLTKILHLGQEVNFGRVFWSATPLRMAGGVPLEAGDAQAWVEIEARSGRDDDPNVYHEYTDSGKEFPVARQRYESELTPPRAEGDVRLDERPGVRASIAYDSQNWSFWSSPITQSGTRLDLRNGAYLQVQITLQSRSFDDFVRLDSVWIEHSLPLADRIVGEMARLDEMRPSRGFTQVELGQREEFAYDLRAAFAADEQDGFDGVRIRTGSRPRFVRLEMGQPLASVEPAGLVEGEEGLEVLLPHKITRDRNEALRVVFAAEVFLHATTFEGEVFDSMVESLPQPIEPGDAGEAISTSSLRVLGGAGQDSDFIQDLQFSSGVLTPNGDGLHDRLAISYQLFLLPDPIPAHLEVYDLQGRRLARLDAGRQGAGPQEVLWDGRNDQGKTLAPGLYLVGIRLRSELREIRHLRPVGVAY